MESIVLEEKIDPNYELTEEEYLEYIESLGIVLPQDKDLLYIAHEALKAQLPAEWKPCQTQDGQVYYFNFKTGQSVWDHPVDLLYREKVEKAKLLRKSKGLKRQEKKEEIFEEKSKKNLEIMKIVALKNSDSEDSSRNCRVEEMQMEKGQEMKDWAEKFTKECEEKKEKEKCLIQSSLEERKNKLLAQAKSKEEDFRKTFMEKIETLRKQLNKNLENQEKDLKEKIFSQITKEIQEFETEYRLQSESKKLLIQTQFENPKTQKQLLEKSRQELLELQKTQEKYFEKHLREVQIGSKLKEFYSEKFEKSKTRLLKSLEKEKQQLKPREFLEDPPDFLLKQDEDIFFQSKNDLSLKFQKFQAELRLKHSSELFNLQQKINENQKKSLEIQENKKKFEKELLTAVKKFEQDLEVSLESYKQEKHLKMTKNLEKLNKNLQNSIPETKKNDSDPNTSKISSLESELSSIKSLISSKTSELDSLTAECKVLQSEIDQTIAKNRRGLSEVSIFSENESPISKRQFISIVSDPESLKQSVFRSTHVEDREKVGQSVNFEKNRIRALKKKLFDDRETWQNQLKDYRASPSMKKYSELLDQKKILDQKIKWHNWRVRELKILEKVVKNGNFGPAVGLGMILEDNARVDTEFYGKSSFDLDLRNKRVVLCE
jgi:hypothetical protein